jgi:hypothetical protein
VIIGNAGLNPFSMIFCSRSVAKIWMIDEQTKRRNINEQTRAYLIGVRQLEEKNDPSRPKFDS